MRLSRLPQLSWQVPERFFPLEFRRFADDLGIHLAMPAELIHCGRDPSTDLHITGGWFHLVGCIVSGAGTWCSGSSSTGTYDFEPLSPPFGFGFSSRAELIAEPFRPHNVIQLQFMTQVAWVLADPRSP